MAAPISQTDGGADETPPLPRGLKTAVIVMGVLLILGFAVVFGTIIYRVVSPGDDGGAPVPARGTFGDVDISLPTGASIISTEISGERALVRTRAETGEEALIILDLRRGRELGRFRLTGG